MKMNIKIVKIGTGFLESDREIADIDICNGNWKINEHWMETEDKIPLTINTIRKSQYMTLPVKDVYPFYDKEEAIKNNNLIVTGAMVRPYDSLVEFLDCRIGNVKEDYRKFGWTERFFSCVLFDTRVSPSSTDGDVVEGIAYDKEALMEVKIMVIE